MTRLKGRQEKAAALLAEDHLSDEAIAAKVGVTRRTLARWGLQPLFAARVRDLTGELADRARRHGIARKERRLAILQETSNRLLQIIDERAADPSMAGVPGGTTGHVVRRPVVFGAKVVYEYAVDTATIKALQSVQEQAAKELGQFVGRHEHRMIRSPADLSDEELEALIGDTGSESLPAPAVAAPGLGDGKAVAPSS